MTTRSDDHLQDALPTQKLEWVTPKISSMVQVDVEGKPSYLAGENFDGTRTGPS